MYTKEQQDEIMQTQKDLLNQNSAVVRRLIAGNVVFFYILNYLKKTYPNNADENMPVAAGVLTRAFFICNCDTAAGLPDTVETDPNSFLSQENEYKILMLLAVFDIIWDANNSKFNASGGALECIAIAHVTCAYVGCSCSLFAIAAPPVAVTDTVTLAKNTTVLLNVTDNDTTNGEILEIEIIAAPDHAAVCEVSGPDNISYEPEEDYTGDDTLTYRIRNANGWSNVASVAINVVDIVAVDDEYTRPMVSGQDDAQSLAVLDNDTIPAGLTLDEIEITEQPANGMITPAGSQVSFVRTVNTWYGDDSFKYRIKTQGGGVSNEATVTLHITNPEVEPGALAADFDINVPSGLTPGIYGFKDFDFADYVDLLPPSDTITEVEIVDPAPRGTLSVPSPVTGYRYQLTISEALNIVGNNTFFTYRVKTSSGIWSNIARASIHLV